MLSQADNRQPLPGATEARAEERRLIERARQGDHEAFARLLETHQRRVFSLIAHLLRRPAEVEDLAQQVFLKVYLALPRFDFRAAFGTWLHRIVVNECYDHLRRQRALKAPERSEVQLSEPNALEQLASSGKQGSADPEQLAELRQLVGRLLARLSAQDRLLLTLREVEGFSVAELAELLRLNPSTVKVRLFRARKRLAENYRRFLSTPTRR